MKKKSSTEFNSFLTERFGNHFWNQVIYHSIQNDEFIRKIINKIPLDVFGSREKKYIAKMVFDFYLEYKTAPKDNFYDLFIESEKKLSADLYNKCINFIGVIKEITGSNWQYISSKIDDAIRHYKLESASIEFATHIKNKSYDEAKATILEAMRTPDEVEQDYFDFFTDKSYMFDRLQEEQFKLKFLLPILDREFGGFKPSWLITLIAQKKAGKTMWLTEMAITAVHQGLNVLFCSLEMDKKTTEARFDQNIGFMTNRTYEESQEVMVFDDERWIKRSENVSSIYDIDKVEENRKTLKKIGGGGLKIVAFHKGRLNHYDIDTVIDELETKEGFVPDVLIVDYLGIMAKTTANQETKERISENCLGLKEIAGKRNLICLTAMQSNRAGMRDKVLQSDKVSGDIDVTFHSDIILSISQTPREKEQNKWRMYVSDNRHGAQSKSYGIIQDLNIGQMMLGEYDINEDDEDMAPESSDDESREYF